jgi:type I restriction enzyme S subunit
MSDTPPLIDIRPDHWAIVRDILRRLVPHYAVWAFGSRAKWTAKPYSDLDLAIITEAPLPLAFSATLADEFSESNLPWRVDVVDWATTSESFRRIIERERVVVQTADLASPSYQTDHCCTPGVVPASGPLERPMLHSHAKRGNEVNDSSDIVGNNYTFSELRARGLLDFGDGYRAKNSELGGEGPVFLRAAYLQDSGFILDNPDRFIAQDVTQFGAKVSRVGDVVVTTKGNSTGRIGVIRDRQAGAAYSPHLSYWRSLNPDEIDQSFIYYWSLTEQFCTQLRGLAHGTDMAPYLSLRDQGFLRVTLPSIDTQRSISAILSMLDARIELNRSMNGTLESMARALFKDWFVDFGPTRAKQAGMEPYLAPELWSLFPERLDAEGKPEGWDRRSIRSISTIKSGKRPPEKTAEPNEVCIYTVYGGNGVSWYTTQPLYDPPFLITGRVGTLGTVFQIHESVWVSDNALCCFPARADYFTFLYFQLQQIDFLSLNSGSTQPLLTQTALSAQTFIFGGSSLVDAFAQITDVLFARIEGNRCENNTLAQTRDLLLPKLMSGEIRVKDAEKTMEAHL